MPTHPLIAQYGESVAEYLVDGAGVPLKGKRMSQRGLVRGLAISALTEPFAWTVEREGQRLSPGPGPSSDIAQVHPPAYDSG
jgi:hypothetical protein